MLLFITKAIKFCFLPFFGWFVLDGWYSLDVGNMIFYICLTGPVQYFIVAVRFSVFPSHLKKIVVIDNYFFRLDLELF